MVRLSKHQAATFIQKQWRGHLGRQRYFAELLAQERNRVKSTKKVKEKKLDEIKLHQPKKQQSPSPRQYKQVPRSNSRDSLDDNRDLDDDDEEDIIVYRANKRAPLIKASDIQSSVSHSVDSLRRSDASMSLNSPQRLPRQQNPHNPLLYQQQVDVSSDSLNPDQYPLEMIEEEDDIIRDSLTNTRIPTMKLQKQSSNLLTTSSSNATPSPHHQSLLSHKSPKHLNPLTKSPSRKMEVHDKSNHSHHPPNNHRNVNNENDEESGWKNPVDEFEEEEEKRKNDPPKQSRRLSEEDGIDELSPRHLIELKEFMYDVDDDGDENEDSLELPIQTIIKKNLPVVKAQPSSHPTTSNHPTIIKSNHNTAYVASSSPAAPQRHTTNPLPSHPTTTQQQSQPIKANAAAPNSNIPRFPSNKRPANTNPSEAVAHQSQQKPQVRSGSGLGGLGGGIGGENSDNDQDNALETIIDKEKFERLKRLYEESSSINDIIAANSPQKKTVQPQVQPPPQPQPPQITKPFVSPRPDHVTPKHTQQQQQPPPRQQQQPLPQSDRIDRNDDNQSKVSYFSQQSTALRSENTPRTNRQQDHNNHQRPISGNYNNHHQIPQQPHIPSNQQKNTNNNHHAFPDDISQISDDFSYQPNQRRGSGGIGGGRGQGRKNSVEVKGKNNNNDINNNKIQQNLPPRHQQPPNNDYREYNDQLSQYSNQPSQNNNYNRQNQAPVIQPQHVEEGYSSQYYQQQIPSPHRLKQQQPPIQQQQGYYQNQYQPPPQQQQQAPPLNKGGGGGNPPAARQQAPPNQPIPNHKQPPAQQPNQPSNQPQKKKPPGQSNGVRGGGINPSASEELEAQLLREIAMLNQKQSHLINHLFDHPSVDINGHPQVPVSPQKKAMGGGVGGGGVAVPSDNNKPRKKEADPKKQKEKLAFGPAAKDFRSKEKDVKEKDKELEVDKKRGGKAIIEGIEPVNPAQIVKEWQQAAYRDQYQQPPAPNQSNHPKQSLPQGMVYQSPEKVRPGGGGGPPMQSPDLIHQPVSLQPSGYLQHFDVKHQYHQQKQRSHSANRQRRNIYDPHDSKSEGGVSSHFSSQQGGKKENLSLPPLISDQRQAQQQIINAQGGYQHPLQQQNRRVANSSRQSTRSAPLHY